MVSSPNDNYDFKARIIFFFREYRIGIIGHIAWAVVSCIIALIYDNLDVLPPNDFAQYYFSAQLLFQNPTKIYDPSFLLEVYGVNAFRYFPTVLILFFSPFSLVPVWDAFVIFTVINIIVCLCSVFLVLEIIRNAALKVNQKFLKACITAFLVLPFFFDFYFFGQISCILGFFLLLSLYFYQKKREVLGSLFLGLSLMVKPVPFFQILFILLAALLSKDINLLFKRSLFILIPLLPDILIFLLVPGMLDGFLHVNFGIFGTRITAAPTASFTNFFVSEFSLPSSAVMLVCGVAIIIIGFLILRKLTRGEDKLMFSFIYSMLGYFLVQVDAWSSQFPYLFPFIIIASIFITTNKARKNFYALYIVYPIATEFFTIDLLIGFGITELLNGIFWLNLIIIIPIVSFSILIITIILIKEISKRMIRKESPLE